MEPRGYSGSVVDAGPNLPSVLTQHRECGLVLRTVCDDGVSVSVLRL